MTSGIFHAVNNQIHACALIGQLAMVYCASIVMEKSTTFNLKITFLTRQLSREKKIGKILVWSLRVHEIP